MEHFLDPRRRGQSEVQSITGQNGWRSPSFLSIIALVWLFPILPFTGCSDQEEVPPAFIQITVMEDRRDPKAELLAYLRDRDPRIRGRAALALGRIGRPADVDTVASLLQDDNPEVRRWAAFALGEIEDSTAAAPLADLVSGGYEEDPEVRSLAVEGLGKLRRHPEACRVALEDPTIEVQAAALLAAWKIPVPAIAELVIERTRHPDPNLRWPAAYCLMRMVGAGASGRTPIPDAEPLSDAERMQSVARLRDLVADEDARVRLQAVRGLGSDHDSVTTNLLLGLAAEQDWRVRVEAVRSLAARRRAEASAVGGGTGNRLHRTIPLALLEPFLRDEHPNVRVAAVEALGRLGGGEPGLRRLEELRTDPEPRVRQVAYTALLDFAREHATGIGEALVRNAVEHHTRELLESPDWSDRALAADGASFLPPQAAIPVLEQLRRDDPRTAKTAVAPLLAHRAETGSGSLLARLREEADTLLRHPDPILRALTIDALATVLADSGRSPTPDDLEGFARLLLEAREFSLRRDATGDVRQTVVAAAVLLDLPETDELLRESCSDPSYLVRRDAAAAMRTRGDEPPRAPEPVESGISMAGARSILEWAIRPHWALIATGGRTLVVELMSGDAPLTCWNFTRLANEGFYDRGRWHRVVPDFVLQDGCPRGDGYGGSDREIRCEINRRRYSAGALGMALSGKDTGSSQFFLTHSDQPHLDGGYTVFGSLVGMAEDLGAVTQGTAIDSIRVVDRSPAKELGS